MSGFHGSATCAAFVEALGLKTLFSAFMGKARVFSNLSEYSAHSLRSQAQKKRNASVPFSEDLSHILGIILSLLTSLPSDTPERIRLLAKFVENNYEKVDKLLDIRDSARTRLKVTDKELEVEKKVC